MLLRMAAFTEEVNSASTSLGQSQLSVFGGNQVFWDMTQGEDKSARRNLTRFCSSKKREGTSPMIRSMLIPWHEDLYAEWKKFYAPESVISKAVRMVSVHHKRSSHKTAR